VLRWFLLLFCWSYLLLRVSRLGLNLLASHPDGSGGLENVHLEFLPMIIAFSSIVSASFAEELVAGTMAFGEMERILFVMIVVVIVMFVGPVTVFRIIRSGCCCSRGSRGGLRCATLMARRWQMPGASRSMTCST
jgi:hypothetical protein